MESRRMRRACTETRLTPRVGERLGDTEDDDDDDDKVELLTGTLLPFSYSSMVLVASSRIPQPKVKGRGIGLVCQRVESYSTV
jgi:hypothetical protein